MASAIVTNIQGYAIHDGPGIRTVVFFKGCPLRCKWCANPENLSGAVQVGFLKHLCAACGRCAHACPENAIIPGLPDTYRIDRSRCTACGACVEACFHGALVRYGGEMTAAEAFQQVRKDKMFYESSGGGVTVSGGEPLLHADFVAELFAQCQADGISTCVETCGFVPEAALRKVLPLTDWFYFDLKHMDAAAHRQWTGQDNAPILQNAALAVREGRHVLFRMPLIPGVNDDAENIRATADFMKRLGPKGENIQLMPYHRAGQTKYDALNAPYPTADLQIMPEPQLKAVQEAFLAHGVNCTISR